MSTLDSSAREKRNAMAREYRLKNPEIIKAIESKRRKKDREKRRIYVSEYGKRNREARNAYSRKWRHENAARNKQTVSKRRAVKAMATIGNTQTITQWQESWRSKTLVRCYWCGNKFHPSECHSDHVIPLCIGGAHSIENLVISCAKCNRFKNKSKPEVWNRKLSQPVLIL